MSSSEDPSHDNLLDERQNAHYQDPSGLKRIRFSILNKLGMILVGVGAIMLVIAAIASLMYKRRIAQACTNDAVIDQINKMLATVPGHDLK